MVVALINTIFLPINLFRIQSRAYTLTPSLHPPQPIPSPQIPTAFPSGFSFTLVSLLDRVLEDLVHLNRCSYSEAWP